MASVGAVLEIYPYRPRWSTIVWASAFFFGCALVLQYKARHGGSTFDAVLATASWGFVVAGVVLAVQRFATKQRIVVGRRGLSVPRARWSKAVRIIPLAAVTSVRLREISGQRFVDVFYEGGRFTLVQSMLPNDAAFERIAHYLLEGSWLENDAIDTSQTLAREPASRATSGGPWRLLALKLAALGSYVGGPLHASDFLKEHIGKSEAFAVTFAPVALMLFGTFSLLEDEPSAVSRAIVWIGGAAALLVGLSSVVALSRLVFGQPRADRGLIVFGCIVGCAAVAAYFWKMRHFEARRRS